MEGKYQSRELYTVFIICVGNILVFVDRFSIFSQGEHLRQFYNENAHFKKQLHRSFLLGFVLPSPFIGYIGDRHSRKTIMIISIFVWSISVFVGTLVTSEARHFLILRAIVGIAQAAFCTVYPSVLADIVRDDALSITMTYINLTVPVGNLLGILLKDFAMRKLGHWWWTLYIQSVLTFITGIFLCFAIEPKRGFKDTEEALGEGRILKATSYMKDFKSMFRNRTFLLTNAGLSLVYFFDIILKLNGPEILLLGDQIISERERKERKLDAVTMFASVCLLGALIGVPLGSFWSRLLKPVIANIDPMICGLGILMSVPFVGVSLLTVDVRSWETIYYIFFAQFLFNTIWAVSYCTYLMCLISTRRCSARAWQSVISRAFGDLIGPIMLVYLRKLFYYNFDVEQFQNRDDVPDIDIKPFYTLRSSIFIGLVINFIGSILFLWDAAFVVNDMEQVKKETIQLAMKDIEIEKANQNVELNKMS